MINTIVIKRTLIKYLALLLLYGGKPFMSIGNWFWKRHRDVLNWNK